MVNQDAENISLEGTINLATTTLRSLFLLNGAAAISILTFAGNNSSTNAAKSLLTLGVKWFVAGLVLCVLSMVAAYFSQQLVTYRIGHENTGDDVAARQTYGREKNAIALSVLLFFLSLGSFVYGAFQAANALAI